MASRESKFASVELVGGHPVLDFVNSIGWRTGERPTERLIDYERFLEWCERAGVLSSPEAANLRQGAAGDARVESIVRETRELRDVLYRMLAALAAGRVVDATDARRMQSAWADAVSHSSLRQSGRRLRPVWGAGAGAPAETPFWRLLHAAVEFLASVDLERLRECDGEGCGWVFLDRSKNRSRRWCSSADCGNRARVREYLARRRSRD